MIGTILLVLLVLVIIGAIPAWPYSRQWGYAPTGGFMILAIILIFLLLSGRL
jgi:hypothetical protein